MRDYTELVVAAAAEALDSETTFENVAVAAAVNVLDLLLDETTERLIFGEAVTMIGDNQLEG